MPKDKNGKDIFVPAIGYEIRKGKKSFNGESKDVEDMYFLVIGDDGKVIHVAAFNCLVSCESDDTTADKLADTLNKAYLLLNELSKRVAVFDHPVK